MSLPPRHPTDPTAAAPTAAAAVSVPLPLAERRRRAAERQDELADILAGTVFDLFLRRLQDKHQDARPGGDNASTD